DQAADGPARLPSRWLRRRDAVQPRLVRERPSLLGGAARELVNHRLRYTGGRAVRRAAFLLVEPGPGTRDRGPGRAVTDVRPPASRPPPAGTVKLHRSIPCRYTPCPFLHWYGMADAPILLRSPAGARLLAQ